MVTRYVPDRGDIVWIDLDPSLGREQKGRRPALILSPKSVNAKSGLALMCPITSKRKNYPFEIPIAEGDIGGVVLADHLRSIDWESRNLSFTEHIDSFTLALVQGIVVVLVTSEA